MIEVYAAGAGPFRTKLSSYSFGKIKNFEGRNIYKKMFPAILARRPNYQLQK